MDIGGCRKKDLVVLWGKHGMIQDMDMLKPLAIPSAYKNHLRLGTCSWKCDSWKGLVYDLDKSYQADDYLADYARYYGDL